MDKKYLIIFWLPAVLLAALAAVFIIRYNLTDGLKKEITNLNNNITGHQAVLASVPGLQNEIKAINDNLDERAAEFYGFDKTVDLVKKIAEIAQSYNLQIIDFAFDLNKFIAIKNSATGQGPFNVPFSAVFNGGFKNGGRFFDDLESKLFIHSIYSIHVSENPDTPGEISFTLEGAIRFFNRNQPRDKRDDS